MTAPAFPLSTKEIERICKKKKQKKISKQIASKMFKALFHFSLVK